MLIICATTSSNPGSLNIMVDACARYEYSVPLRGDDVPLVCDNAYEEATYAALPATHYNVLDSARAPELTPAQALAARPPQSEEKNVAWKFSLHTTEQTLPSLGKLGGGSLGDQPATPILQLKPSFDNSFSIGSARITAKHEPIVFAVQKIGDDYSVSVSIPFDPF